MNGWCSRSRGIVSVVGIAAISGSARVERAAGRAGVANGATRCAANVAAGSRTAAGRVALAIDAQAGRGIGCGRGSRRRAYPIGAADSAAEEPIDRAGKVGVG